MLWKIWIKDLPDLSNSCESMCFPQLWIFLWVVETNNAFEKSERAFWHYCTKNKMIVIWEYSISHTKIYSKYPSEVHQSKQCINFNSVCFLFFVTHMYLLDSIKLSLRCKCAIVSFIIVFVQSAILSLSKYQNQI